MKNRSRLLRALAAGMLAVLCLVTMTGCTNNSTAAVSTQQNTASGATYQITLDPNGGAFVDGKTEPVTISVTEGTPIDFASYMPAYEGNTLYGWYMPDGMPWPGARKVSGNVSLKAKWDVAEVEVVYDLQLVRDGEKIPMEYDNGVYQFTVISQIYGGYAQRSGKYTLYMDEMQANMDKDDGTVGRVLYHAGSNYIDSTGTIYAEFYNDGEFELFYDYTNAGERTKYHMDTGYWTYAGYTAPIPETPLEEDPTGMGAPSGHIDWDTSLIGGGEDAAAEEIAEQKPEEAAPAYVTVPGEVMVELGCDNSETMKLHMMDNGVVAVLYSTFGVYVDTNKVWAVSEDGTFTVCVAGAETNVLTPAEDGKVTLEDNYNNLYTFDPAQVIAAVKEPVQIDTANATNSDTMFAFFYDNHTVTINYSLAGFGMEGYHITDRGQWNIVDGVLSIALSGQQMELTDTGDTLEFTIAGNTYAVNKNGSVMSK